MRSDGLELKSKRYHHQCDRTTKTECVPVRFVSACKKGHIDEFPWIAFTHEMQDRARCPAPSLRLIEGSSGDFSEIEVRCVCGASRTLTQATLEGAAPLCRGLRVWLGPEGKEECGERSRLLVRTASNGYFSQVVSALSVPEQGRELEAAVRKVWDVLKNATPELLPAFRQIDKVKIALGDYADAAVMQAIDAIKAGVPVAREPLRTAEFKQFVAQPLEVPGVLPPRDELFWARECVPDGGHPAHVKRVVLAHKLREVRVQIGFTRIEPVTPDLEGEFDLGVQSAMLGLTTNWLPASEVRGEGVFIQLDEASVTEWEDRRAVKARGKALIAGYDAWVPEDGPDFPGVRYYLLHSLAHLLISAISLECGYAASAIRERIYCAPANADTPMAALLLSTGSSGSEGTLGGLVEQGRRLREHLRRAFDLGALCSNDPVCAAHSPEKDHAERYLEGAACHGCLFIAECSCERFNRYLDRGLVVPTIGQEAGLAFFSERP